MIEKESSRNKSYFLITSEDSPGWKKQVWSGPYKNWKAAHEAAQAWNEGVFTEVCQGHQVSPYVDILERESKNANQ